MKKEISLSPIVGPLLPILPIGFERLTYLEVDKNTVMKKGMLTSKNLQRSNVDRRDYYKQISRII